MFALGKLRCQTDSSRRADWRVDAHITDVNLWRMSTLIEIEALVDSLPVQEQQELMLYIATRLHAAGGVLPPPRNIPKEQIDQWIADDEAGYRNLFLARERAAGRLPNQQK